LTYYETPARAKFAAGTLNFAGTALETRACPRRFEKPLAEARQALTGQPTGADLMDAGQRQYSTEPFRPRSVQDWPERFGRPSSTPFSHVRQWPVVPAGRGAVVQ
jgi:hypothetical protein